MAIKNMHPTRGKVELFFERHARKMLLGITLLIGFFGMGDMVGGAADLAREDTIFVHSLTGKNWSDFILSKVFPKTMEA